MTLALRIVIAFCVATAAMAASAAAVRITERINLSAEIIAIGGIPASVYVMDVSADGSVVVGNFSKNKVRFIDRQVYRYVRSRGMEDLGPLADGLNNICVSADGAVIWGSFYVKAEGSSRLFRYTSSGGLEDLGTLGRRGIQPTAASVDGATVVGYFVHEENAQKKLLYHAFRFSERAGFEDLGRMGTEGAFARGVSADGSAIVGNFAAKNHTSHAFRYSRAAGLDDLGAIGGKAAFAKGISDNGVVVGTFNVEPPNPFQERSAGHVFLYTPSAGVTKLGTMGGTSNRVVRISADGKRVVGSYTNAARESFLYVGTVQGAR